MPSFPKGRWQSEALTVGYKRQNDKITENICNLQKGWAGTPIPIVCSLKSDNGIMPLRIAAEYHLYK